MSSTTISQLSSRLAREEPFLSAAKTPVKSRAMVGCIVRPGSQSGDSAEMLIILRAIRENDPWSGQTAFPGGRCEIDDNGDDMVTVVREVWEEIGVDLSDKTHYRVLGRVSDIEVYRGGRVHMVVGCIVFEQIVPPESLTLAPLEVAACGWVPLSTVGCATSDDLRSTYWAVPRSWGLPSYTYGYLQLLGLTRVAVATLPITMRDPVRSSPDIGVDGLSIAGLTLQFASMIARDSPLRLYRKLPLLGSRIPHKFNSILHDLMLALYHSTYNRRGLRDGSAMHFSYFCFLHGVFTCLATLAAAGAAYVSLRSRL